MFGNGHPPSKPLLDPSLLTRLLERCFDANMTNFYALLLVGSRTLNNLIILGDLATLITFPENQLQNSQYQPNMNCCHSVLQTFLTLLKDLDFHII